MHRGQVIPEVNYASRFSRESEMTKIANKSFNNVTEILDGRVFENCSFTNCSIVYRGGTLPVWANCQFTECRFGFEDAAERTLNFLRLMYHGCPGMGPQIVGDMFERMCQPFSAGGSN